jgi:hypothetical protein
MQRIIHSPRILAPAAILLAVMVSVPLTPLSPGRAAAAGGTTVTMNGQVINADLGSFHSFGDNGPPPGTVDFNLSLFQSGTTGNGQITLFYEVYTFQWDPVNLYWQYVPIESGYGTIPNSAVHTSGGAKPSSVSLQVDTSTLSPPAFQRSAGSGGMISLTWKPVPGFTFSGSGSQRGTFGFEGHTMSWTTAGSHYNTSAVAQGSLIGRAVPDPTADNMFGDLGSFQGVSLCRGCTP